MQDVPFVELENETEINKCPFKEENVDGKESNDQEWKELTYKSV